MDTVVADARNAVATAHGAVTAAADAVKNLSPAEATAVASNLARVTPPQPPATAGAGEVKIHPKRTPVDPLKHITRNASVTTPFGAGRIDDIYRGGVRMPPLPRGDIFDHQKIDETLEPITGVDVELFSGGQAHIRDVAARVSRLRLYEMGSDERLAYAASLKKLGNGRFAAGDLKAAAQAYDQALVYAKNALTGEAVRAEGAVPVASMRRQVELWLACVLNLGRARMRSDDRAEQKRALGSLALAIKLCSERIEALHAEKKTLGGGDDGAAGGDAAANIALRAFLGDGLVKAHYLTHRAHVRLGDLAAARKELRLVARARPGQKRYAAELAQLEALIKRRKKKDKKKRARKAGFLNRAADTTKSAKSAAAAADTAASANNDEVPAAAAPAAATANGHASPPVDTNTKEGRIAEQKRKWSISNEGGCTESSEKEEPMKAVPAAAGSSTVAVPRAPSVDGAARSKDGEAGGGWSTWAMVAGGVAVAVVVGMALARRR